MTNQRDNQNARKDEDKGDHQTNATDGKNGETETGDRDDKNGAQKARQEPNDKRRRSFFSGFTLNKSPAARDPLERYHEILADENLDEGHKGLLMAMGWRRFHNRQIMAYIALVGILVTMAVVLGGVIADGSSKSDIIYNLKDAANLLGVTNGLLTAIVASYFGVTSFRPSS